ncbi:class I SAM-dependent methyltransferase [Ectothiorhodospiraceae bacterium 2226]|nr:class I SAM-dependent methyltransferase [Ectothiorhodospiraceae bacterium 2226]
MSRRTLGLDDRLYTYLLDASLREPPLLAELREETARDPMADMQIAPEQGQFLALLVRLLSARRVLEIGTFTGYSALWMALALPGEGRVVTCDLSDEWTAVARRYWQQAGVGERVELRLGPAAETLRELRDLGEEGRYDLAFIDADKASYDTYYEHCLALVRPGGLIAVDNVLWGGSVADPSVEDADTAAIRALNRKVRDDARVDTSLLPLADGLLLARRRGD